MRSARSIRFVLEQNQARAIQMQSERLWNLSFQTNYIAFSVRSFADHAPALR
jgi:hypothetical protein